MAILSPTPTEKKEHQEEQRTREPKAEADVGGGGGGSPVQCTLRVTESKSSFLLEKANGTRKKWEGSKRLRGRGCNA